MHYTTLHCTLHPVPVYLVCLVWQLDYDRDVYGVPGRDNIECPVFVMLTLGALDEHVVLRS